MVIYVMKLKNSEIHECVFVSTNGLTNLLLTMWPLKCAILIA